MDKQLKDYLHFYLGCQIDTGTGYVTLTAVQKEVIPCTNFRVIVLNGNVTHELMWNDRCKIVLRKLESIDKEESEVMETFRSELRNNDLTVAFRLTHYLLSRGFDLFGLIDAGLAIDKATSPRKRRGRN